MRTSAKSGMPPGRTRPDPGLERSWHDELAELAGDERRGRRAGTLLDATVGGEVRHREALSRALGPEVEAGFPLDGHRERGRAAG